MEEENDIVDTSTRHVRAGPAYTDFTRTLRQLREVNKRQVKYLSPLAGQALARRGRA